MKDNTSGDATPPHTTDGDIAKLRERVRGGTLRPGDTGYAEERSGFQRGVDPRPEVIVVAADSEDVRVAVEFATAHGLPVAVRSTGHGTAGGIDGGVLVSTGRMNGLRVDPAERTVHLEAGVRWGQVVAEAARHGLAPLNGSAPHVGAIGYTLGGGLPLLGRSHGYAADRVRAIDMVTADARARHVTPDSDPERFWATLGGKDNFGVVTSLDAELVPVGRIYGGGLYFDADRAADILAAYCAWTDTVPEEMNSSVAMFPIPDLPEAPEALRGRHIVHVRIAHAGPVAEGERHVATLRGVAPPLVDTVGEMPYADNATIHNEPDTPMAYTADNVMLDGLDGAAARAIADVAGPGAPVPCIVELRHLGGALARGSGRTSVGHRDATLKLGVLSPLAAGDPDTIRATHQRLLEAVGPGVGRFLNDMGFGEHATPDRVRTAFDPDDYRRLTRLKAVYDPDNTFRCNHNIPPADSVG